MDARAQLDDVLLLWCLLDLLKSDAIFLNLYQGAQWIEGRNGSRELREAPKFDGRSQ